jgi:membrane protein DedA with SNARE-associated domain
MDLISRELVEPMLAFMRTHASWAPLILFGIMLLEGIIFTTFIFSGTVVILAAGALIQNQTLSMTPVFLAIFTGFWVGDTINFMIGQTGEKWFRGLKVVKDRPEMLTKAEAFLIKWDVLAIFLSRFMGPSRPLVTFLAGTFHMRPYSFHAATVISTFLLTAGLLNAGITGVELLKNWK